jgi:hypothetical protein
VSAELGAVVDELLAHDPSARPKSAALVAARLRTWLAQRHPEGVANALGQRAEQARARAQLATEKPPPQLPPEQAASAVTRSIATSKQLSQLIHEGTEPLARKSPQPQPALEPAPSARPSRTRWTLAPLLAGALVAALILLQRQSAQVAAGRVETAAHPAPKPVAEPAAALVATEARPAEPPAPAPTLAPADRASQAPSSAALPTSAARARLSINALPWAELRLDGRPLGATPKRALAVTAGTHVLQLDCPPLGRHAQVSLKLAPGDDQHVLVDLNTTPPQVTQR